MPADVPIRRRYAAPVLAAGLAALMTSAAAAPPQRKTVPARRTELMLANLLRADHAAWGAAHAERWGAAPYETELRILHTAAGLAVRFEADDDAPWHTLTERDDPLWNEEVVEIFIDPDGDGRNYVEIEINPANVVCDLQIFRTAPALASDIDWDFAGLETRTAMRDAAWGGGAGWIATAVLPWSGFAALRDTNVELPPRPNDRWRFNVFRIKRPGGAGAPEHGAIYAPLSPTPTLSFHAPEAFMDLIFPRA